MRVPFFQVDAFASARFTGNPAAVMPLDAFLETPVLQAIAAENNLSETAFLVRQGADYQLRWFTPSVEVPLCGHATLASAAVVMERLEPGRERVVFHTASGPLTVTRAAAGYCMDFPLRPTTPVACPPGLIAAIGATPLAVRADDMTYLAVLSSADEVRSLLPYSAAIAQLDRVGLIVTARDDGKPYDFVSRYFTPRRGIAEDPVTGSAHCVLVPYWSEELGPRPFHAYQASQRGGIVDCRLNGARVELTGACVFFLEGQAEI